MRFKPYFLAAGIIALGLFLRFYKIEQRVDFGFDQEVASWWLKSLLIDHKFSLIGQEVSVGSVFIAPFYYYFLAPFYLLTHLYPLGGSIFALLGSLATMILLYFFSGRVFNKKTALITTFLDAIHPGIINYDLTIAPSNLVMFLSVATALILITKANQWLLGILLGLSFSIHPTAVLLIPISVIYLFINKQKINKFALAVPIFLLTFPVLLFELRHQSHFAFSASSQNNLLSTLNLLLVYWAGILVSNDQIFVKIPLFILIVVIFWKSQSLILKLWLIIPFIAAAFYPWHIPEYYFLLIIPIVLSYSVGFLCKVKWRQIILAIIILISTAISFWHFRSMDNPLSLNYKNQAVNFVVQEAHGRPFTVYYSNDPGQNAGFSYLFWWHQAKLEEKTPLKFLIIIPAERQRETAGATLGDIKVVLLPE